MKIRRETGNRDQGFNAVTQISLWKVVHGRSLSSSAFVRYFWRQMCGVPLSNPSSYVTFTCFFPIMCWILHESSKLSKLLQKSNLNLMTAFRFSTNNIDLPGGLRADAEIWVECKPIVILLPKQKMFRLKLNSNYSET